MDRIDGNFSQCIIEDALEYMKRLPNKIFDLSITDFPWGSDFDASKKRGFRGKKGSKTQINYYDKWRPEWNLIMIKELQRVSKQIIMAISKKRLKWWIRNTDPVGIIIVAYPNGYSSSKISRRDSWTPYLCYGNFKPKENKIHNNVEGIIMSVGFMKGKRNKRDSKREYINPSPKDHTLWEIWVKDLKPRIMYDPTAGSGCLCEVGERLGIETYSTEINLDYIPDIKMRIREGIRAYNPRAITYQQKLG
jgi:DNA modification methylase